MSAHICPNCGNIVPQTVGKRKKDFCNTTCRSNFWQKQKRINAREEIKIEREKTPHTLMPEKRIAPQFAIRRSFENYQQLRLECDSVDEWQKLKSEILDAENLSTKQKQLLTT